MGLLHERMAEDLRLRGLSPSTGSNYLLYCRKFAAFYMRHGGIPFLRSAVQGAGRAFGGVALGSPKKRSKHQPAPE